MTGPTIKEDTVLYSVRLKYMQVYDCLIRADSKEEAELIACEMDRDYSTDYYLYEAKTSVAKDQTREPDNEE